MRFWEKRQERWKIVELFQENPNMTIKEAAQRLDTGTTTTKKWIKLCQQTFMLPRIPKRQWTAELVQEAVEYSRREETRRSDIQQYGLCQNCGETGKEARQYRKLVDDNYWMLYKVCSNCGRAFDHTIKGDEGSMFELNKFIGFLREGFFGTQMDDDFKLAKSIVKKIERGEYVPRDQIEMVFKYLEKWTSWCR